MPTPTPPAASGQVQPAAGVGGRPAQQQQGGGGFGQSLSGIIRIAVFWYFASKFFSPKPPPSTTGGPPVQISNLFRKGELLDMWFYVSENEKFIDFGNENALIWHETKIPYAVWKPESTRTLSTKYYPSEALKNNGSLFAHVFFARSGYLPDPSDPEYNPLASFGVSHPIVIYLPKRKADKKKSLLGSKDETEKNSKVSEESVVDTKDEGPPEWVSYWKPNVTVNLVDDFSRYTQNAVPPNIAPRILQILCSVSNPLVSWNFILSVLKKIRI